MAEVCSRGADPLSHVPRWRPLAHPPNRHTTDTTERKHQQREPRHIESRYRDHRLLHLSLKREHEVRRRDW